MVRIMLSIFRLSSHPRESAAFIEMELPSCPGGIGSPSQSRDSVAVLTANHRFGATKFSSIIFASY